jgi:histidine triad (HIT) family protein
MQKKIQQSSETIFDKIIRKEIPAQIVFEDDHVLAFKDIQPQAPVHILVIPKKKIVSFVDVKNSDGADMGHFMQGISKTAEVLGLEQNGYRVVFNSGRDAQQTVPYIHAHILAGRILDWPPG